MPNKCAACLCVVVVAVGIIVGLIPTLLPVPEWKDGVPDFGVGEVDPACREKNNWWVVVRCNDLC